MNFHDVPAQARHGLRRFVPARVVQSQLHKRTYTQFAEKIGLVYFGYVDQRNDEHSLIRGLTVSTKHRDNHYCIGSFEGYDISLVERTDTLHHPSKAAKSHTWMIMTLDLHRHVDLPHIFVGLHTHSEAFYAQLFTKFAHLSPVLPSDLRTYDPSFARHYTLYAKPEQAISAERLFNHSMTAQIAETFGNISIEISEGCLYLYLEDQKPTVALLEKMLSRGLWLANCIDQQADVALEY